MRSAWLGALLLVVASWSWWGAIPAAAGQPAGSQVCKKECNKITRSRIPLDRLQSYERMKCGKPAVRLTTIKNGNYCADPNEKWVLDAMRALDARNAPVPVMPGHSDKFLGSVIPVSAQAGRSAYPIETFSTAAYGMSISSVTRAKDPKSSAVSSTLVGPLAAKPSAGFTSKPEVIVSSTTLQPEPLANRSTPSYSSDGPKSFGEGLSPAGKGLEDIGGSVSDLLVSSTSLDTSATEAVDNEDRKASPTRSLPPLSSTIINLLKKNSTSSVRFQPPPDQQGSPIKQVTENPAVGLFTVPRRRDFTSPAGTHSSTDGTVTGSVKKKSDIVSARGWATEAPLSTQANRDAFRKSLSTLSHSGRPEGHFMKTSGGEAMTPSPEAPLPLWLWHRSHIITVVFLGFALCIYLAITAVCAKSHICTQALSVEMVRGLTYSNIDPQTNAYNLQVL